MQSRQPLTTSRKSLGSDRATGKEGLTTGVKLRGPEGAQRLRATSASTSELGSAHRGEALYPQQPMTVLLGAFADIALRLTVRLSEGSCRVFSRFRTSIVILGERVRRHDR
jgi:hypothetical protein